MRLRVHATRVQAQQGFLFELPPDVLRTVLYKAGPRARQLCKALLICYGPLPCLTPRGAVTNIVSALTKPRCHRQPIRALDLQHVDWGLQLTHADLKALCTALPGLQTLQLPHDLRLTLAQVAAATACLSGLTALHLPRLSDGPMRAQCASRLVHLKHLTLPSSFLAPPQKAMMAVHGCTGLSRLCFGSHNNNALWVGSTRRNADVLRLASEALALLPELVALEVILDKVNFAITTSAELQDLFRLSSLKLSGAQGDPPVADMLHHVGALSNLRSLHLSMVRDSRWNAAERGWLSRLTLLTSLHVSFELTKHLGILIDSDEDDEDDATQYGGPSAMYNDVVSCVPGMPALRKLHIAHMINFNGSARLPASACADIATASSTLRLLHLVGLPAANLASLATQLTRLTCLRLSACSADLELGVLTTLPNLRELWCGKVMGPLVGCLPTVETLCLEFFLDVPCLERLRAAMPQLRRLGLHSVHCSADVVLELRQLSTLEVLGISQFLLEESFCPHLDYRDNVLLPHLKAVFTALPSLRRCYLGGWNAEEQEEARALLGQEVDVVFQNWWKSGVMAEGTALR